MPKSLHHLRLATAIFAVAALLPASAMAQTSEVTGSAGSELSMSVSTPAAMTFTPSTDGTTTSVVTVTSTAPSWTLSIKDAASSNAGFMYQANCSTGAAVGGGDVLNNAMQWSASTGSSGTLSGTNATVRSGSLIQAITMTFTQPIGATEDITAGNCYKITTTYTLT